MQSECSRALWVASVLAVGLSVIPWRASAGYVELSAGFSWNRSNYSEQSFSWTKRVGFSIGYHFTERSQIELSLQDVTDRTRIVGFEDTIFHDRIYSLNWVQALTGKKFPIQPYFKVGVAQLNREATGTYSFGTSPPSILDAVTAVVAVGMRVYVTQRFAIRTEATSYLSGGNINTWKDNTAVTAGLSVYL